MNFQIRIQAIIESNKNLNYAAKRMIVSKYINVFYGFSMKRSDDIARLFLGVLV